MQKYFDKFQLPVHNSVHSTLYAEEFPVLLQAGQNILRNGFIQFIVLSVAGPVRPETCRSYWLL